MDKLYFIPCKYAAAPASKIQEWDDLKLKLEPYTKENKQEARENGYKYIHVYRETEIEGETHYEYVATEGMQ